MYVKLILLLSGDISLNEGPIQNNHLKEKSEQKRTGGGVGGGATMCVRCSPVTATGLEPRTTYFDQFGQIVECSFTN